MTSPLQNSFKEPSKPAPGFLAWIALSGDGDLDVFHLLISRGADIYQKNYKGDTALHYAAEKGHTEIVRFLLDNGADIHQRNDKGNTALHYAAKEGHTEVIRLLLDNGADIHEKGDFSNTALIYTTPDGHTEAARLLIDRGASLNEKNRTGRSALVLAAHHGQVALVRLLIDKRAKIPAEYDEWPQDWTSKNEDADDHQAIRQMLQKARTDEEERIKVVSSPRLLRDMPAPKVLRLSPK
jgi:ankyrin repeat protein